MWAKVAEEMAVPWRAAEAMHWQLGEADMARRAGTVPFSLTTVNVEAPHASHRASPSRGHAHSQSQGSLPREMGAPSPRYGRGGPPPVMHHGMGLPPQGGRPLAARRESIPDRPPPPPSIPPSMGHAPLGPNDSLALAALGGPGHHPQGLAPIQAQPLARGGGGGMLPGLHELTTGVSPYSTPAYAMGPGGIQAASPVPSQTASPGPGPMLPALGNYPSLPPPLEASGSKRRASPPDVGSRETSRRRHHDPRHDDPERRRMQ